MGAATARPRRDMSIRLRLAGWYGAALLATVAALGAAVDALVSRSLLAQLDAMLAFELEEATERLVAGAPAEALAGAPAAFHEAYYLRVLTPGGRILAESPALGGLDLPPPGGPGAGPLVATLGPLGRCRVATAAIGSGPGGRVLRIATSLAPLERERAALRSALWAILPPGAAVATLGGYWLAGRALAPVRRMTAAARRISAANLGDRIEVAHPGDELGGLALTLNAMLDRIAASFEAARRFTADAAHELRTPLAAIRAEAEVALLAPRAPEEYRRALRSVVEEAERLARLADRLLLLAADDAGAAAAWRPVGLDELVRSAAAAAEPAASRAGVALRVAALPPVAVEGDPDLLRQVFDNLIDNALKYTPAGGVVSVRGSRDAARARIEVADDGVGIPAEALPRVFDRFYRADASRSRRTGGNGLGLSIARAVVERHGGTIEAESVPGRGSTFRVSLPATADAPPASMKKNSSN